MEQSELEELLGPTATAAERVRGLLAIGLTPAVIGIATRSSASTIRNWSIGATQPRSDAMIALDDLRTVAKALLELVGPERAALWLTSRDPARFGGLRPVEMIPLDPMEVLAAAHGAGLKGRV